jgi:hypothetical protein
MSYTRTQLRAALENRLNAVSTVWSSGDLNGFIDDAIEGLYPSFYKRNVQATTAGVGPSQTLPAGARNLYMVGLQRVGSNRVRPLRNWVEGQSAAMVPKSNIAGATLVWAWTSGWTAPATDLVAMDIVPEAREVLLLRAEIAAFEELLSGKLQEGGYGAVQLRQMITEDEVVNALQAKHASLQDRLDRVVPLPEVLR